MFPSEKVLNEDLQTRDTNDSCNYNVNKETQ